jgi:hypothetical protein
MKRETIQAYVKDILKLSPEPIPQLILKANILGEGYSSVDKQKIYGTDLVKDLVRYQWEDGSWGRFHSQDTKRKDKFKTSQNAIVKAKVWGLDKTDAVIKKAIHYMEGILEHKKEVHDPKEKSPTWPIGVEVFTAATLAVVDPENPLLDRTWQKCFHLVKSAFSTGTFDMDGLRKGYSDLGINFIDRGYDGKLRYGYLFIANINAIKILATRASNIPENLAETLVNWIWNKPDGIGYTFGTQLSDYLNNSRYIEIETRIRIINDLRKFRLEKRPFKPFLSWIEGMESNGLWDFGPRPTYTVEVPLSNNWRNKNTRKIDYSVAVLRFLRNFAE